MPFMSPSLHAHTLHISTPLHLHASSAPYLHTSAFPLLQHTSGAPSLHVCTPTACLHASTSLRLHASIPPIYRGLKQTYSTPPDLQSSIPPYIHVYTPAARLYTSMPPYCYTYGMPPYLQHHAAPERRHCPFGRVQPSRRPIKSRSRSGRRRHLYNWHGNQDRDPLVQSANAVKGKKRFVFLWSCVGRLAIRAISEQG